jgi:hypothetical protein
MTRTLMSCRDIIFISGCSPRLCLRRSSADDHVFKRPVRRLDFELVDCRRRTQTEMQIAYRSEKRSSSADH